MLANRVIRDSVVCGIAALLISAQAISATVTRVVAYQYEPTTGLRSKEIQEPTDSNLCLVKTYTYDAYGNPNGEVTRNCNGGTGEAAAPTGAAVITSRTAGVTYDATGRFPQTLTNALSQNETRTYDERFESITNRTDINSLATVATYDNLGRKTLETRPDGNKTSWTYLYCSGVNGGTTACPTYAKYVIQETPLASDGVTQNGAWKKTYFNALDREVRSETQGFDGTVLISKATEYTARKEVYRTSRPYYTSQTPQWTTFTYDALSRVTQENYPDSSVVTRTYNGLTNVLTHPLSRTKTTLSNSQKQTVRITDAYAKQINYTYDPFGNLVKTVDPLGNVVTITYNVRGHRTGLIDPDLGSWTYTNDALGQVVSQQDALAQTSSYTYDVLGRTTQRTMPDLVLNWTYDACTKGVGRLCQATTSTGYQQVNTYDVYGRPNQTNTQIDAAYTQSTSYDANGRIDTQTYPTGQIVKNVYNVRGYLTEVRNGDVSNALYWQANTVDAEGQVLLQTFGNGVTSQQSFNPANGRLNTLYTGAGNAVQNFTYSYDALGNILTRTDGNQSLTETFTYDLLNRLLTSTVNSSGAGIVSETYGYNDIGNVTSRSDFGSYTYPASGTTSVRPHAVSVVTLPSGESRQYTYDANGNLTSEVFYDNTSTLVPGVGRNFTYASFNLPTLILTSNGTTTKTSSFDYGPDLQRVRQISSVDGTTIYLNPDNNGALYYEKQIKLDSSVEHRHYITAYGVVLGLLKQTSSGTDISYLHRDNLGSTTTVTDALGAVVERLAYEPFGKRRFPAGMDDPNSTIVAATTERGFTNHEHLDELGLIHMNGRLYEPMLMRFTTADPTMPNAFDLQSYNRYAYVRNNPLRMLDPSGFTGIEVHAPGVGSGPSGSQTNTWSPSLGMKGIGAQKDYSGKNITYEKLAPGGLINNGTYGSFSNWSHGVLTVTGAVPVVGVFADVVDVGLTAAELPFGYSNKADLGISIFGVAANLAPGAGDAATTLAKVGSRSARAREATVLGKEGESVVRAQHDIGPKPTRAIDMDGRARLPDGINRQLGTLSEVKNVEYLSMTKQIRDYMNYARNNNLRFDLYTRPDTIISKPLQNAIDSGLVNRIRVQDLARK